MYPNKRQTLAYSGWRRGCVSGKIGRCDDQRMCANGHRPDIAAVTALGTSTMVAWGVAFAATTAWWWVGREILAKA